MKQEQFTKEDYVLLAKLAQQTQRYDEMVIFAQKLLQGEAQLVPAQRSLCASAYKNFVVRELRVLQALVEKAKADDPLKDTMRKYSLTIRQQITECCLSLLKILDEGVAVAKHQIKSAEAKTFYLKLKADQLRYLCEQSPNTTDYAALALKAYEEADFVARNNLPQTNAVRLALHLNMSAFLVQIGHFDRGNDMASRALDDASANIDTFNENTYKECTMILQLISDNLHLWREQTQ